MAYPIPLTATLSGATVDQLAYWRRATATHTPLLEPDAKRSGRYLYSWADVVALRSIVYLRQFRSLPRIRNAVQLLRALDPHEWRHLSAYKLRTTGTSIFVVTPDGTVLDIDTHAGTVMSETLLADVLNDFVREDGRTVPQFARPKAHVTIDPTVLGGYPVVSGTRVPYHVVAGLAEDGYTEAEIIELYPSVKPGTVADSRAFAQEVARAA